MDPGTSVEGYALLPTMQYVYDVSSEARPTVGTIDIGAFEYPTTTAISALLLSADADASGARLQWYAPGDEIVSTSVYRRTDQTDWVLLGHPQADVGHHITYEDRTVAPGIRYEYRLVVRDVFGVSTVSNIPPFWSPKFPPSRVPPAGCPRTPISGSPVPPAGETAFTVAPGSTISRSPLSWEGGHSRFLTRPNGATRVVERAGQVRLGPSASNFDSVGGPTLDWQ